MREKKFKWCCKYRIETVLRIYSIYVECWNAWNHFQSVQYPVTLAHSSAHLSIEWDGGWIRLGNQMKYDSRYCADSDKS